MSFFFSRLLHEWDLCFSTFFMCILFVQDTILHEMKRGKRKPFYCCYPIRSFWIWKLDLDIIPKNNNNISNRIRKWVSSLMAYTIPIRNIEFGNRTFSYYFILTSINPLNWMPYWMHSIIMNQISGYYFIVFLLFNQQPQIVCYLIFALRKTMDHGYVFVSMCVLTMSTKLFLYFCFVILIRWLIGHAKLKSTQIPSYILFPFTTFCSFLVNLFLSFKSIK